MKLVQNLFELNKCISLSDTIVKNILSGDSKRIVISKLYRNEANQLVYLSDGSKCYGIVKLGSPEKISVAEFKETFSMHNITEELRKSWWPNKLVLFSYPFERVLMFESPKEIKEEASDEYFHTFEFSEKWTPTDYLHDYSVENRTDARLISDWRVVCSWVDTTHSSGKAITVDSVLPIARKIHDELNSRDLVFEPTSLSEKKVISVLTNTPLDDSFENSEIVENNSALLPMTPKDVVFDVNDISFSNAYVRKVMGGNQVLILKENDSAFFVHPAAVEEDYTDLLSAVSKLSSKDLLIQGEIVTNEVGDSTLYLTDCLYYGKNIFSENYSERFKTFYSMVLSNSIKKIPLMHVQKESQLKSTCEVMCLLSPVGQAHVLSDATPYANGVSSNIVAYNSESKITKHNFFRSWSSTMAYYLGFLSCDGYLDVKTSRVEVNLGKVDSSWITGFARALGDSPKAGKAKYRFKSQEMAADLIKLGMGVKKPTRTTHAKVPSQYKWDFARGCFDADGNVGSNKLQFVTGNAGNASWIASLFKSVPGASEHVHLYKRPNHVRVVVTGIDAVKKVHSKLYSGSGPKIARKAVFNSATEDDYQDIEIFEELNSKYSHINFRPTPGMKTEARRGLAWRKEFGRGGTPVGVARARDIANDVNLSPSTVRRMFSFFSRHKVNKKATGFRQGEDGFPSNGRIAWALWGGDAGFSWCRARIKQMDAADNKELSDNNPYASKLLAIVSLFSGTTTTDSVPAVQGKEIKGPKKKKEEEKKEEVSTDVSRS